MIFGGEMLCFGFLLKMGRKFGCVVIVEFEFIKKGLIVGKRIVILLLVNGYDVKWYWVDGRMFGLFWGRNEKFVGEDKEIGVLGRIGWLGNEIWGSGFFVLVVFIGLVIR